MTNIPWEIAYGLGAALLGAVLIWAIWRNSRRNKANDPITEKAVKEEYDHPDRYADEEDEFRDQLSPDRPTRP